MYNEDADVSKEDNNVKTNKMLSIYISSWRDQQLHDPNYMRASLPKMESSEGIMLS